MLDDLPDTGAPATVEVREFRLLDGLKSARIGRGLIRALAAAAGAEASSEDAEDAMAEHAGEWLALLALATGRDAEWLARLSDANGAVLAAAQWEINGGFSCAAS